MIREYRQPDCTEASIAFDSALDRWVIEGDSWEPFGVDLEDVLQWVSENQPQLLTGLKMQGAMHSD